MVAGRCDIIIPRARRRLLARRPAEFSFSPPVSHAGANEGRRRVPASASGLRQVAKYPAMFREPAARRRAHFKPPAVVDTGEEADILTASTSQLGRLTKRQESDKSRRQASSAIPAALYGR